MADETLSPPPISKERSSTHISRIIVKVVEIILAVFIIGLMVDPLNSYQRIPYTQRKTMADHAILYIAVDGYLIINLLFLIAYALGDKIPKRTSIMFSAVGSILHVVAASIMIHNWRTATNPYVSYHNYNSFPSKQYNDMLISASVFTFVNSVVFGIDVFVTMRNT